ncbi:MAG: sn-glycerol-3-phosphate ABC transporter ATP-binding protein UgpC [Bacilli bacterium]|nr:sn-glycerol-3-phosphate ABC transporter ATP-binding protein UgpC [Bacilli bacterium]
MPEKKKLEPETPAQPEPEPVQPEAPVEEEEKDLAYVSLRHVDKIYDNNVQAVFDFNLDIAKKEFIVFVGPSGCGKSTTLRMIAGLEDISRGELWIDGEYSNDRTPKDRDIAMVFQSYALYPHMTVYNNMAFGLKIRHLPREEIDRRVREAARILQIEEYLDRKPKALSGGQRQRVALGRAIVRNAKVFLMDEPLSNLDAKLRVQMRSEIIKLHESLGATTIYVTHDQTEAMTMASRIVVMKKGYIQQIGSPIDIYNDPANLFVATFIGSPAMNIMLAKYNAGAVTLSNGIEIKLDPKFVKAHDEFYKKAIEEGEAKVKELQEKVNSLRGKDAELEGELKAAQDKLEADKAALQGEHDICYGIRPEDIHDAAEHKSSVSYEVEVAVAELLGHEYYIHSNFGGIDMVAKIPLVHEIKIGDTMKLAFNFGKAHIFDPISENRIF